MLKSFLKSLEDPKRRLLGPSIWSLQIAGFLLPQNRILLFFRMFIHFNVAYFVFSQFLRAYIERDNIGLAITVLQITMLTYAVTFKIASFIFFQKNWHEILDYVTEADEYERDNQDDIKAKIINDYTKYSRKVTYFYWGLMFSVQVSHPAAAVGPPLIQFITSDIYRGNFRNGTTPFPEIFYCWYPFDYQRSPNCWFVLLWHYLLCANGAALIAAYDASLVVIMIFFGGKLDLLRERCREMFGKNGKGKSDDEFKKALKQISRMHTELIKHARLLNSLVSPVMFFYLFSCTLMLCSSLFQLTSEAELFRKLVLGQYLMFCVFQLFLICLPSNYVLTKSQDVALGPYESEWWGSTFTTQQKRCVVLLCGQLRQEIIFTGGPFTELNLPTFLSILKGAYSYYTLLRD